MTETVKYLLDESRMPKFWYNLVADLPKPPPPVLHPGTQQPIGPDDLAPLFPMTLIQQEVATEREIEIPAPVREIYRQWRPSPLYRARRLEKARRRASGSAGRASLSSTCSTNCHPARSSKRTGSC